MDGFGSSTRTRSSSVISIYCIHGNSFGVARCCEDLETTGQHAGPSQAPSQPFDDELDESTNLIVDVLGSTAIAPPIDPNCACHDNDVPAKKKARRKLVVASILCIIFMTAEVIGGLLAGSLAIAADAAHLLTDFASNMVALFSIWVSSRPATRTMSFGWHRAEVIGATASVLMIWVLTGILVYAATLRVQSGGDFEIDSKIMLITSGIGVVFNICLALVLHQSHHEGGASGRGHGGDGQNLNVSAAFTHVIGDLCSSLGTKAFTFLCRAHSSGVLTSSLIIYFRPDLKLADPICTFIFSVLVIGTTLTILRNTINVLMMGIPKGIDYGVVDNVFLSVEGIVAVHDLRIWGLTTDKTALSAHLAIRPGVDEQEALKEATAQIRAKYDIHEMTLQVEMFEDQMKDCGKCKPPK